MGIKYTQDQKLLIDAAREGQIEVIRELMTKGVDLDCELKYGSSALMIASSRGYEEIVRLIAAAGGKVNRRNKFGISPLSEAAERGHHKVLRTLVEYGADVNMLHNNGSTAILAAAVRRDLKTVKVLLELGADVDIENFDGWSARKWIVSESDLAFLEAVGISRSPAEEATKETSSADPVQAQPSRPQVSSVGQAFWTVFMRAAATGDLETVRRLADDGIEINGQSPNGTTALIAAIKNDRAEIACELVELGADISIRDNDGLDAISWAQKRGLVPFLKVITKSGATSEPQDERSLESQTCQQAQAQK